MKPLLFALPLLGCVDASQAALLPEGTTGSDVVGGVVVSWVVLDGQKLVSEDLSLGPAVERPALYASANPDKWSVWNTGSVTFCIHTDSIDAAGACTIRRALADLSVDGGPDTVGCTNLPKSRGETPLHFEERTCAELEGSTPYLDFEVADTSTGRASTTFNYHGMTITFAPPTPPATGPNFNQATVLHETGHALGLTHEQQRDDAAQAQKVRVISSCIRTDVPSAVLNFTPPAAGIAKLTPYDVESIMQYPSYSLSSDSDTAASTQNLTSCPANPFTTGVNTCPTELFLDPAQPNARYCTDHGWESGIYRGQFHLGLTAEDINGLAQLYEQTPPDGCLAGAQLGSEMAGGDLDGDGYGDLAVAIGGTVRLYKGTVDGLVFWETLRVSDFAGSTPSATDQFGAVLAIGKLAGTNTAGTPNEGAELFVGAPGYNHGAGAAFVWQPANARAGVVNGTTAKPTTEMVKLKRIDPPGANERSFGRAIALGSYTAKDQLAISTVTGASEGRVEIMAWNGTSAFTPVLGITAPHPGTFDGFGLALASGDLDGVGKDEIAIGAPYATVQGGVNGAVYVYGIAGDFTTGKQVFEASPTGLGDQFGLALKIGHRLDATHDALVVGAPTAGAGRVVTFAWDSAQAKLTNRGSEAGQTSGDRFGTALRLADEDGDGIADLFIGAPNAANGKGTVTIRRTHLADVVKTGDGNDLGFGAALAIGNFDGSGTAEQSTDPSTVDLVVGAPQSLCGANQASGGGATYFKNLPGNQGLDKQRQFAPGSASPASVVP